ncbi:MAG: HEPN domain-containing protein [Candidatus Thorarchaeota archaeon]
MRRAEDWLRQAEFNLEHAEGSLQLKHFDWACFAAQQGAEMAVKAVFRSRGAESWGHSVSELVRQLPEDIAASEDILKDARRLDRLYIPARYPNGLPAGTPREAFDEKSAKEAIIIARTIIEFCKSKMAKK